MNNKKIKSLLSAILAVCMVLTMFVPAGSVFAEENQDTDAPVVIAGEIQEVLNGVTEPAPEDEPVVSSVETPETPPEEDSSETAETVDEAPGDEQEEGPAESETPAPEGSVFEDINSEESQEEPSENEDVQGENEEGEPTEEGEEEEVPAEEEPEAEPEAEFVLLEFLAKTEEELTLYVNAGDTVTLSAELNRDDVQVSYQWQRMRLFKGEESVEPIFDYPEDAPTNYMFLFYGQTERELLEINPDAVWSGIELYYAIISAMDDAGIDSQNVSIANGTENLALRGFEFNAAEENGETVIFADKGDEHYEGRVNQNGQFEFDIADGKLTNKWVDIEGANESVYTFEAEEDALDANYRCIITITDEEYKTAYYSKYLRKADAEEQETQEAETAEEPAEPDAVDAEEPEANTEEAAEELPSLEMISQIYYIEKSQINRSELLMAPSAVPGNPAVSSDVQWITGLTPSYEYITKDMYDMVTTWLNNGEITQQQADRYWTRLGQNGWSAKMAANELDPYTKKPTGGTRYYRGFKLTNGSMLEVNSDWYGKTVYFRVHTEGQAWSKKGTALDIPAYTKIYTNPSGAYDSSVSGTRYKEAVSFLNAYVYDVGPVYSMYLRGTMNGDGWLTNEDNSKLHITDYYVTAEKFNANPQEYMVDAEGTYRIDSFAWGVCVNEEPDISGKAYWELMNFLSNGYGMIVGHDTMYAYSGSYYDAFGIDLDESLIDPNDGLTWYYKVNSWNDPGTTAYRYTDDQHTNKVSDAGVIPHRGGHFYINELMGTNAGNVNSGNVEPRDSISMVLSAGGSHGFYGKAINYGTRTLHIKQTGFPASQAKTDPRYRTPTNYPYTYSAGETFGAALTHTNNQFAFGTIWVDYVGKDESFPNETGTSISLGPTTVNVGDYSGTNNFYLSGTGNFLINQVGHIPPSPNTNFATFSEVQLFTNSVFYVSQRKQCEICAANQHGIEDVHFVIRINKANARQILTTLREGGNFWYPLNACYQLVDDLDLEALFGSSWTPIEGFTGHWDSDVYKVRLSSNGLPLLANDDSTSGWNLGTDQTIGTEQVFAAKSQRTTGVSRVLGDLNDLFTPNAEDRRSYAGYRVEIRAADNPLYFTGSHANEVYDCRVNPDSKYVISNLPCIYNETTKHGILRARVFDTTGREVTEYGSIYVNVKEAFWDNDMTIPLYLGSFSAEPVEDQVTYEEGQAKFVANGFSAESFQFDRWQYFDGTSWRDVPVTGTNRWGTVSNVQHGPDDGNELYSIESSLILTSANPAWDGYRFRAVFKSGANKVWNSDQYYWLGNRASNEPFTGSSVKTVSRAGYSGELTVKRWPAYAEQDYDVTVGEGQSATFTAYGMALADAESISVTWQYSPSYTILSDGTIERDWYNVDNTEFPGHTEVKPAQTRVTSNQAITDELVNGSTYSDTGMFWANNGFYEVRSTIKVVKVDAEQDQYHFRAKFTSKSKYGTTYEWYSNIADNLNGAWQTSNGRFSTFAQRKIEAHANILTVLSPELRVVTTKSANFNPGNQHPDTMTPDEYGQALTLSQDNVVDGSASYQATIYYRPDTPVPDAVWKYQTYTDRTPTEWNTTTARAATGSSNITVSVSNTTPVPATVNGESDWMSFVSTMTINNIPADMYRPEALVKYFFACYASDTIETVRGTKTLKANDKWGGLVLNYQVAIEHQGVLEYGNTNIINGETVVDATDGWQKIVDVTNGHTSSEWKFPQLAIKIPASHFINTVIVQINPNKTHDARDSININSSAITALGVKILQADQETVMMVSDDSHIDAIAKSTWETILREYVTFTTYDTANYTEQTVSTDTTGGTNIIWKIDEGRMDGCVVDPSTGVIYKAVSQSSVISYNNAKTAAQGYEIAGATGRLASARTASANEAIRKAIALAGGSAKQYSLAATNNNGTWQWDYAPRTMNWTNWKSGANTTYAHVAIEKNGKWTSAPIYEDTYETALSSWSSRTAFVENAGGNSTTATTTAIKISDLIPSGATPLRIRVEAQYYAKSDPWADVYIVPQYKATSSGSWTVMPTNRLVASTAKDFGTNATNSDYTVNGITVSKNDGSQTNGSASNPKTARWTFKIPTDGLYSIRMRVKNHAGSSLVNHVGGVNLRVRVYYEKGGVVETNTVKGYIVEFSPESLWMANTNHSDKDDAYIGTNVTGGNPPSEKHVRCTIVGNSKIYDGTQLAPYAFNVDASTTGAGPELFEITYQAVVEGNHADYTERTVNGADYENTGAINATRYRATVRLTDAAIADGWILDASDSQMTCYLTIYQRPVNVYSHDNDKPYDRSSEGTITNIQYEPKDDVSGVIPGDTVLLTRSELIGTYLDSTGTPTIHNSENNNNGDEYDMIRNEMLCDLGILHNETSDPHYNYKLGTETYSGDILKRPVIVHSLYLEDPDYPRNVKMYDGTDAATIRDILIDNVLAGDDIGLDAESLAGTYATRNAGEDIENASSAESYEERMKGLDEVIITASEHPNLTGNTYGDYYIAEEHYSGAIAREALVAQVASWAAMYGIGLDPANGPKTQTEPYEWNSGAVDGSWLDLVGLVKGDTLTIDDTKGNFKVLDVDDPDMIPTKTTPVGRYEITYEGLTEENYEVLKNYVVVVLDGYYSIRPRTILVTVDDSQKIEGEDNPIFTSTFSLMDDDEENFTDIASDKDTAYEDMLLVHDDAKTDTVANTITVLPKRQQLTEPIAKQSDGSSNITYVTECDTDSKPVYDIEEDTNTYPCEFCEDHFGTATGTDHWKVGGYGVSINQDSEEGNILGIAYVENPLGEMVQNYQLIYAPGLLTVHPTLRFQLLATVPMYICMYGFNGDGNVIEPDEYGITNYSNGMIQVTNINASRDGWILKDVNGIETFSPPYYSASLYNADRNTLQAGEMYMRLMDTVVETGDNVPLNGDKWIIAPGNADKGVGAYLRIPINAYIAGGNVNKEGCTFVSRVTYTVAEYGKTMPYVEGVDLPDTIGGEDVIYVTEDEVEFTVTFDGAGGTVPAESATKKVTYASAYGTLPVATRTGFKFNGWFTAPGSEGQRITSISYVRTAKDHTLYAHWTAKSVDVTFNPNGGSITQNRHQRFEAGTNASIADTGVSRPGFTFLGWSTDQNASSGSIAATGAISDEWIDANEPTATLYAIWQELD